MRRQFSNYRNLGHYSVRLLAINPILILFFTLGCSSTPPEIDLSGEWKLRYGGPVETLGESEFSHVITLPGSLQKQGYGEDVSIHTKWTGQIVDSSWYNSPAYEKYRDETIKVPFWLNPEKTFVGDAWYQKEITIPASWKDMDVYLYLERPHWETTLFVNNKEKGSQNSLATPHIYLIDNVDPGTHVITIKVANNLVIPVGENAHSVSDHTQSNWNGIIGQIKLIAKPKLHINRMKVTTKDAGKKLELALTTENNHSEAQAGSVHIEVRELATKTVVSSRDFEIEFVTGISDRSYELQFDSPLKPWSEFSPELHEVTCILTYSQGSDKAVEAFGNREISTEGRTILLNNNPIFLRGTLESAIFPLTGYPAMDEAYWTKIYKTVKAHGLNHIRFHSWCPPKVAFEMADKEGVYLQVESGTWTTIGVGTPVDEWLYAESQRILAEYGNHPSFIGLMHGNEPQGNSVEFLTELVDHWKQIDGRHLYSSGAGWPFVPNADFFSTHAPRIHQWGDGLKSEINRNPPNTLFNFDSIVQRVDMPSISHEIGQWCVYPNFEEIPKYTGVLKAKNFEIFEEVLNQNGLGHLSRDFLLASGKLQALCYKADIEAALRTREFSGFQLLDLHDFPGQGTALVGVLDAFWDPKGYITAEEYSQFSNATVPLALLEKFTWEASEKVEAEIEISHFGERPLENVSVTWEITNNDGNTVSSGEFVSDLALKNKNTVGKIAWHPEGVTKPEQFKLTVTLPSLERSNSWNLWVMPTLSTINRGDIRIASKFDTAVIEALENGEKVLLTLPEGYLKPEYGGDIEVGFSPIFWNTAWTLNQPPHELGLFMDPKHPIFDNFPTSYHSDYQWWHIVTGSSAINLDSFDNSYMPIIHFIDDWFTNRKLALVTEMKVGEGKLLISGKNLSLTGDNLVERHFLNSLLKYMDSDTFDPQYAVDVEQVGKLFN